MSHHSSYLDDPFSGFGDPLAGFNAALPLDELLDTAGVRDPDWIDVAAYELARAADELRGLYRGLAGRVRSLELSAGSEDSSGSKRLSGAVCPGQMQLESLDLSGDGS